MGDLTSNSPKSANDIFDGCTLWLSPRSPFGRRVRLALLENQVSFHEKMVDVFHPPKELLQLNPLARIPVVQLKSGEVLIDSHLILQLFYHPQISGCERAFAPKSDQEALEVAHWQGIATGLCEKIVEFFLDSQRPKNLRDPEVAEEMSQFMGRCLPVIDQRMKDQLWLVGQSFTQADIDWAAALTYLAFRYSTEWRHRYSAAAAYLDRLESRPHFITTKPLA